MIYMLFDNPSDKQNMMFLNKYETKVIKQVYPNQKCNSIKKMLEECRKIIKKSLDGDTIICWYDFMAVLCWWLCKIFHKKRKIIAINILLKNKKTIKNKLVKILYKSMLKSNDVQATVTSLKYGEYINKILGINKKYTLLRDIYHDRYNINYDCDITLNSVFCGGYNGRDWNFLIEIAKSIPEVTFNCVIPKEKFEKYKNDFGKNMIVKTNISEKEFLKFMCQSCLVAMPLDTEAPAGLIVFYQAAANGKMSITSNTVTTQEYFKNDRGVLCENSIDDWKNKIKYYLCHLDEANSCVAKFKDFLEKECVEEKYANTLWRIIK